jgi:hypothetical protein
MKDGGFFIIRNVMVEGEQTRVTGLNLPPSGRRGFEREIILRKPVKTVTEAWELLKEEGY